jgi:hypothetical protein
VFNHPSEYRSFDHGKSISQAHFPNQHVLHHEITSVSKDNPLADLLFILTTFLLGLMDFYCAELNFSFQWYLLK